VAAGVAAGIGAHVARRRVRQQLGDRLPGALAGQIPQRQLGRRNGLRHRAVAADPLRAAIQPMPQRRDVARLGAQQQMRQPLRAGMRHRRLDGGAHDVGAAVALAPAGQPVLRDEAQQEAVLRAGAQRVGGAFQAEGIDGRDAAHAVPNQRRRIVSNVPSARRAAMMVFTAVTSSTLPFGNTAANSPAA
jgi:hypothetical protein